MTLPDAKPATVKGLYAIGAAGLGLEALVLLLAAPAVISLERGHVSWLKVGYMFALAVLLIVAAGMLRRRGGKVFGSVLQVLAVAGGVDHLADVRRGPRLRRDLGLLADALAPSYRSWLVLG